MNFGLLFHPGPAWTSWGDQTDIHITGSHGRVHRQEATVGAQQLDLVKWQDDDGTWR
jgi:hypothetical protein